MECCLLLDGFAGQDGAAASCIHCAVGFKHRITESQNKLGWKGS